jgi:hypothetical protein
LILRFETLSPLSLPKKTAFLTAFEGAATRRPGYQLNFYKPFS